MLTLKAQFLAIAFLLTILPLSASCEIDVNAIYQQMKDFDALCAAGLSVAGDTAKLADKKSPGLRQYGQTFQFTQGGDKSALYLVAIETPHPDESVNSAGERYAPIVRKYFFHDEEVRAQSSTSYMDFEKYNSAPSLQLDPKVERANIHVQPTLHFKRHFVFSEFERALGRGYTRTCLEPLRATERNDGLLEVSLKSSELLHGVGEWKLVVDPSATCIVREAKFCKEGSTEPVISVWNSGTLETSGSLVMPAKGGFEDTEDLYIGEQPFNFASVSATVDIELLQDVRAACGLEQYEEVILSDMRDFTRSIKKGEEVAKESTLPPGVTLEQALKAASP